MADYREFRLSDAYEKASGDPNLELRVIMLNVNDGHNKELMEQCEMMREYSQYVARVRTYTAQTVYTLEQAVERAVQECIEEGIKIGKRDGIEISRQKTMIKLVKNLANSNLPAKEIAEMLEEDESVIRQLMEEMT